jgi:polysaccharide biosynthesis transport protein
MPSTDLARADEPTSNGLVVRSSHALQTTLLREDARGPIEDGLDLSFVLQVIWKYKWLLVSLSLGFGLIAAVQSLRSTPVYRTSVMLQIDRAAQRVVAFNQEVDAEQQVYDDGSQLQTQIELLKSSGLAERVIDELGLYKGPSPTGTFPDSTASVTPNLGENTADSSETTKPKAKGLLDRLLANYQQLNEPADQSAQAVGRLNAINAFRGSISIEPIRNSRLVSIAVTNSNPALAARIANTMASTFIAMNLERKLESSTYAKTFLVDQLRITKAKLEESERVINEYAKKNQILSLGENSDVASQGYADLSSALSRAEGERIQLESIYAEVVRNPESAPQTNENKALQTFKEQKARLESEYTTNKSIYKPDFPKMVQLRAQIEELDQRIKTELGIVVDSIKGQFEAAKQKEALIRSRLADSRREVLTVQDRSVDLNLMKRELETNRQVYDSLLQRIKEVAVTGGLTTNNISIVDEAKIPQYPFSPQPERYAAIGMALGLLLGLGLAFLRESLDDSIKNAEEIEQLFGLPLLGLIPHVKSKDQNVALSAHENPRSPFAEAYRSMRTALQFSTTEGAPKRLMVTSCGQGEGKTTTAIALAINFAQLGQSVLLIDCDMRSPSLHKEFRLPNERGLSNFLAGDTGTSSLIQKTHIPNLSVLTAGPLPPDPVELLMGAKFLMLLDKAHEIGFSQVIVDSPPMLGLADALVLGNQIQHSVFAIKAGQTRKSSIKNSLRRLRGSGIVPMGVVLTHAQQHHAQDYSYGDYYGTSSAAPATPQLQSASTAP